METLSVKLKLNEIICHDEGDGWGDAEPYLWTVFFKVDGETVSVTEALTLSGVGIVQSTPGSHGNLGNTDVDEGETVPVPSDIGEWLTTLKPIPVPSSLQDDFPNGIGGMIGVICILMEEDNVTDDGAEAGHNKLNEEVEKAINAIIPTISFGNQDIEDEINEFEDSVSDKIKDAIVSQQYWFEDLWSWLNKDDTIGSKSFTFTHDSLEANMEQEFSHSWDNEGQWEINGKITASPLCTIDLTSIFASKTDRPFKVEEFKKFRDLEFIKKPSLLEWGNILLRNNLYLIHQIVQNKNLQEDCIALCLSVEQSLKDRKKVVSNGLFGKIESILKILEATNDKRTQLDIKRIREIIPNLKEKNADEIIKVLESFPPGKRFQ